MNISKDVYSVRRRVVYILLCENSCQSQTAVSPQTLQDFTLRRFSVCTSFCSSFILALLYCQCVTVVPQPDWGSFRPRFPCFSLFHTLLNESLVAGLVVSVLFLLRGKESRPFQCAIISGERQIFFLSHLNWASSYTYDVCQFKRSFCN